MKTFCEVTARKFLSFMINTHGYVELRCLKNKHHKKWEYKNTVASMITDNVADGIAFLKENSGNRNCCSVSNFG